MGIEPLAVKDESILASDQRTEPTRIEGTVKRTHAIRVESNGDHVATRGDFGAKVQKPLTQNLTLDGLLRPYHWRQRRYS